MACCLLAGRPPTTLPNSPSAEILASDLKQRSGKHSTCLVERLQRRLGSTWVERPAQASTVVKVRSPTSLPAFSTGGSSGQVGVEQLPCSKSLSLPKSCSEARASHPSTHSFLVSLLPAGALHAKWAFITGSSQEAKPLRRPTGNRSKVS